MFDFKDFKSNKYSFIGFYSEGLAPAESKDGWGYLDKNGNEVIKCKYLSALPFSEGLAAVESENGWGYINKKGENVIPCCFKSAISFKDGFGIIKDEDSYAYIDSEGKIHGDYTGTSLFCNGKAIVTESNNICVIDTNFNKLIVQDNSETCWKNIVRSKYYNVVRSGITNRFGYIDDNLKVIVPVELECAKSFTEDKTAIYFSEKLNGFIDKNGVISLFYDKYLFIEKFYSGLALVRDKNNNYGYINKSLKEVIPCKYIDASNFSENLASVKFDNGLRGYINKKGEVVIEPKYIKTCNFSNGVAIVKNPDGRISCIDKKGNTKFIVPLNYYSILETEEGIVKITADSEEELSKKKIAYLKNKRDEVLKNTLKEYDDAIEKNQEHLLKLKK